MKRKLFAILTLCIVACLCLTGLTACDLLPSLQHEHNFNGRRLSEEYLATPATCTQKGKYYYSCDCGEKDVETFEHGEPLGHNYGDFISNNDGTHTKVCANDGTHIVTENCSGGTATCTEQATCNGCGEKHGELVLKHNVLGENDYCDVCGKVCDISLTLKLSYKLYEGTRYETIVQSKLINEEEVLDLGFVKIDAETYVLRNIAEGDILSKVLAFKPIDTSEYYSSSWKYYNGAKKANVYYGCEINAENIITLNESKEIVLYAGVGCYWTPGYV